MEKKYVYVADHRSSEKVIDEAVEPYRKFPYIKDAADDVIEKKLKTELM